MKKLLLGLALLFISEFAFSNVYTKTIEVKLEVFESLNLKKEVSKFVSEVSKKEENTVSKTVSFLTDRLVDVDDDGNAYAEILISEIDDEIGLEYFTGRVYWNRSFYRVPIVYAAKRDYGVVGEVLVKLQVSGEFTSENEIITLVFTITPRIVIDPYNVWDLRGEIKE